MCIEGCRRAFRVICDRNGRGMCGSTGTNGQDFGLCLVARAANKKCEKNWASLCSGLDTF